MMDIILKILVVAVTIAFLSAWGYIKQQRRNQELLEQLHKKVKEKIIESLKKNEFLTKVEIEEIVKGTKASLFWSKNKIQVTDPKLVTQRILNDMVRDGLIAEELNKGPKKYKLNHSKGVV